ncbi:MAG: adenylate kinase family protein [Candidatus Aenigmatarchaeota archaeon]
MILAVSGTPTTGKTAVCRLLSKKIDWKLIELNELAKQKKYYCGFDEKRNCEIVDVDKLQKEISKIEGNLIIESHFAHEIFNDLTIILRTNPKELRERMTERGWEGKKIEENILAEIMEVCLSEAMELSRKVIVIDTTNKTPEDTVTEILEKIDLEPETP